MIRLKRIFTISLLVFMTLSCEAQVQIDSLWNKEFCCAQDIIDTYIDIKNKIRKKDKEQQVLNACHYVWHSGEYMFKCRGKNEDIVELPQYAEELELDNEIFVNYMLTKKDITRFTDHYFTLQAMKRGYSFEESRDGVTMTVFFPLRSMNENDYDKLQKVFSCKNDTLHQAYLKKMVHPLTNNGCNKELLEIRNIIEKNVADSELKWKIMNLYETYSTIMQGTVAPDVAFKDTEGNGYTISQFRGKVLVMDVWATWCSSCLKNMPKFMDLKNEYAGNEDVAFVTVSTDSEDMKDKWLASINKFKMGELLNLTPDRSSPETFEEKYLVSSVPRYIVIDKEGNIISAFAPKPGEELKMMILKALKD